MLKKKNYILILVLLFALTLSAQRESANWYFGFSSGLDFNSGIPEVLSDGQITTTEGCSTVSDNSGNLLFYTEGVDVWDKNHNIMQNGENLLGDNSSSQSTIVVPNVSNSNIFYLFTADVFQSYLNGGTGNGFNYSIIDISLNGGLGSVINKNINLLPQSSEKVSAVSSLDGSGFWVVTHAQNEFYAYKVDGGGVNLPVVSNIGINIDSYDNIRGAIKLSPNGEMLAITHAIFDPSFNGFLSLFDFNLSTGVVSNEREIGTDRVFYGVEFSPDSSKLFASAMLVDDSGPTSQTTDIVLYQYDLNFEAVDRTEFIINTYESDTDNHLSGALQLGFDKKVYHSILETHLSVIYQPNLSRRSADFREFSVSLGSSTARYGLPSYEQSAFESIINVENLCFNNPTEFNIIIDEPIQTISWDFGDPASGINNTSTNLNPTHIFTSTGRFAVTIKVDYVNRASKTYIDFIEIGEAPMLPSQVQLTQCDVDADDGITKFNLAEVESSFGLSSDDLVVTYFETLADALENENTLNELGYENTSNGQLIYAKVFVNTDCYSIIEVILNVEPMSNLGEYSTIFVCQENPDENLIFSAPDILALLENDFTNANISIYYNESDALLEINNLTGNITISNNQELKLYFRVETINDCDFIGSIVFSGVSAPIVEDKKAIFCASKNNILDAGDEFWSYLWSTGETTREIEINGPGNYWVEVSTGINCSDIVNFEVKLSEELEIIKIEVDDFRPQNSVRIILDDYSGEIKYSLDGLEFSNSNYFDNVTPGIYNVQVKKDDCQLIEQTILVGGYPNYFTPNGDGINDTWKIKQPQYFQEAIINVFDRYGKLLKVMKANDGWDGKHEGNILTPSDYWFSIELNNKVVFGHFTLKL